MWLSIYCTALSASVRVCDSLPFLWPSKCWQMSSYISLKHSFFFSGTEGRNQAKKHGIGARVNIEWMNSTLQPPFTASLQCQLSFSVMCPRYHRPKHTYVHTVPIALVKWKAEHLHRRIEGFHRNLILRIRAVTFSVLYSSKQQLHKSLLVFYSNVHKKDWESGAHTVHR